MGRGVALAGIEECLHVNKQTGSFPCLVCLCGFTFIFFGAFTGKHTAGNNWLVDRLRRPAHKPGRHECRGLCASFSCHAPLINPTGVVEVNNQIIISRGIQKEAEPDSGFQQQTSDWAADVVPVCGCYLETLNHIVHHVASPALPRPPAHPRSVCKQGSGIHGLIV